MSKDTPPPWSIPSSHSHHHSTRSHWAPSVCLLSTVEIPQQCHNQNARLDLEDKTWTDKVSNDNARRYVIKGHCTPVLSGSWFYSGPSKFPLSDLKEHSPGTHPYLNIPHCIINNRPSAQRDAALQHFIFYRNSFNNIILESPQGFQCHHLNAKMSP